jgi:hypothetical protein
MATTMILDDELGRQELERALWEAPAYRRLHALDLGSYAPVDDRYAALPLTTPDEVRAGAPRAYLPAADLDGALTRGEAALVHTGRLTVAWSQSWWEASQAMSWSVHPRLATLAGVPHRTAVLGHALPAPGALVLAAGGLLDQDQRDWSDDDVRRMRDQLDAHAPAVLAAVPGLLATLCARAEALGLRLPAPAAIVLSGARPSRLHRSRIARLLSAPVATAYASPLLGHVFFSCELGSLHQNVRSCRVEVARWRPDPSLARLVVTPFGHPFMSLLRFDTGDLVRLAPRPCGCGRRHGLTIADLEGPLSAATVSDEGAMVTPAAVDDLLWSSPAAASIVDHQLVQPAPGELLLRLAATGPVDSAPIAARLRRLHGHRTRIAVAVAAALDPAGDVRGFDPRWHDQFEPARVLSQLPLSP